jgi:hypothetical protein
MMRYASEASWKRRSRSATERTARTAAAPAQARTSQTPPASLQGAELALQAVESPSELVRIHTGGLRRDAMVRPLVSTMYRMLAMSI